MKCSRCHATEVKLVEVYSSDPAQYDTCYSFPNQHGPGGPKNLCEECLSGYDVPVFRPLLGQWHVGEVKEYDPLASKHRIEFLDTSTEWLTVDSKPTAAYIAAFFQQNPGQNEGDVQYQNGNQSDGVSANNESQGIISLIEHRIPGDSPANPSCLSHGHITFETNANNYTLSGVHRGDDRAFRKAVPRMWSAAEDDQLLQILDKCEERVKWPVVAQSIPGRTGKQCRERYLNHLKPKLKVEEWTPVEDALIFEMHRSIGSKWATMSKIFDGRTDSSIKNRFHHLMRKLEKDRSLSFHSQSSAAPSGEQQIEEEKDCQVRHVLPLLVSYENAASSSAQAYGYSFGPFREAKADGEMCNRCHLIMPSLQTGKLVCEKSGWCLSCTSIPAYVSGKMLREVHSRRASMDHLSPQSTIQPPYFGATNSVARV